MFQIWDLDLTKKLNCNLLTLTKHFKCRSSQIIAFYVGRQQMKIQKIGNFRTAFFDCTEP